MKRTLLITSLLLTPAFALAQGLPWENTGNAYRGGDNTVDSLSQSAAARRAATELNCAQNSINAHRVSGGLSGDLNYGANNGTWVAQGCGRSATYQITCLGDAQFGYGCHAAPANGQANNYYQQPYQQQTGYAHPAGNSTNPVNSINDLNRTARQPANTLNNINSTVRSYERLGNTFR